MSFKKLSFLIVMLTFITVTTLTAYSLTNSNTFNAKEYNVEYQQVWGFSDGLARVEKNDKWGYIDTSSNLVIPFKYDYARDFSDGLAFVGNCGEYQGSANLYSGKCGLIDLKGKTVIPFLYSSLSLDFINGIAKVFPYLSNDRDVYAIYFDTNGNKVDKSKYKEDIHEYKPIIQGNKYGYKNKTGKIIVPIIYDVNKTYGWRWSPHNFSDGLVAVEKKGMIGFVNTSGKEVINFIYGSEALDLIATSDFHEGVAAIAKGNLYGYIDTKGKTVVAFRFDFANKFDNGYATALKNGKLVIISKK